MGEFLHSVTDDDVPTFNYVVDDLAQCLYTDSVSDAQDDGIYDDARGDSIDDAEIIPEMMMPEMIPEMMMLKMMLEMMSEMMMLEMMLEMMMFEMIPSARDVCDDGVPW